MSDRHVQVGRVVMINFGPDCGKLATIVDIVDQSRALVDGPKSITGVTRRTIPFNRLSLTPVVIKGLARSSRTATLQNMWNKYKVMEQCDATAWVQKLKRHTLLSNLTDFQRFEVMTLRKKRAMIVGKAVAKQKAGGKKTASKKGGKK
jgi:large subunit ribosomal protein L14e